MNEGNKTRFFFSLNKIFSSLYPTWLEMFPERVQQYYTITAFLGSRVHIKKYNGQPEKGCFPP
jgi:hypothetical protein